MSKTLFESDGWMKFAEKDNYRNGCQPNTSVSNVGRDRFSAPSIPELVTKLQEFCDSDNKEDILFDSCEEKGRIDIQVLEDENGTRADKSQIALWKKNQIDLYLACYTFNVEKVTRQIVSTLPEPNTDELMVKYGQAYKAAHGRTLKQGRIQLSYSKEKQKFILIGLHLWEMTRKEFIAATKRLQKQAAKKNN